MNILRKTISITCFISISLTFYGCGLSGSGGYDAYYEPKSNKDLTVIEKRSPKASRTARVVGTNANRIDNCPYGVISADIESETSSYLDDDMVFDSDQQQYRRRGQWGRNRRNQDRPVKTLNYNLTSTTSRKNICKPPPGVGSKYDNKFIGGDDE